MTRETDEERDKRTRREILIDTYAADEQAISWCYHLEHEITFPFQARCIKGRTVSLLREGEEVPVVGMTDEVVSSRETFVLVGWRDGEFGVPSSQFEVLNIGQDTQGAVGDRHYWNGDGGRLG